MTLIVLQLRRSQHAGSSSTAIKTKHSMKLSKKIIEWQVLQTLGIFSYYSQYSPFSLDQWMPLHFFLLSFQLFCMKDTLCFCFILNNNNNIYFELKNPTRFCWLYNITKHYITVSYCAIKTFYIKRHQSIVQ